MISSEKEIGTCVLTKMLIYSIIAHKFRYPIGSDINLKVDCVTNQELRCDLFSLAHTIQIMLTSSLSTKVLRITFARKDEAAGNNGLPLGTNALQVRREAQDFRRGK